MSSDTLARTLMTVVTYLLKVRIFLTWLYKCKNILWWGIINSYDTFHYYCTILLTEYICRQAIYPVYHLSYSYVSNISIIYIFLGISDLTRPVQILLHTNCENNISVLNYWSGWSKVNYPVNLKKTSQITQLTKTRNMHPSQRRTEVRTHVPKNMVHRFK